MVGHQPTHLSAFNHLRLGRYADLHIILSQSDSQPDLKGFLQKDCVLEIILVMHIDTSLS